MLERALAPERIDALVKGIARGEYSLLLGAGASLGGSGGGRPLPTGTRLAEEITADFGIPTEGVPITLADAYEEANGKKDAQGHLLGEYLKSRFWGCTPAPWHSKLPSLIWRRIWTLNIDDTIEQAYAAQGSRRQVVQSINWDSPHSDPEPDGIQVVHLHGRAQDPDRLVFSILEYMGAVGARHAWHRIFGDHFVERPFIVVGASLRGEADLAEVVRRGSLSQNSVGLPTVLVAESFTAVQRGFLERHGIAPVEMSADAFFQEAPELVRRAEDPIKAAVGVSQGPLPLEAQAFLEQFTHLTIRAVPPQKTRDFYQGYDPTWYDVLTELDAEFAVTREITESLNTLRREHPNTQRLELIHGTWSTGKSTALLRVGREQIRQGQDIYLFRGETTLDAEAAAWWLQRRPDSVLLFDGIADFAPEIASLLEACNILSIRAFVVGAERHYRLRRVHAAIPARFINEAEHRWMKELSNEDINALLGTLRQHSRLGKITRWSPDAQFRYFAVDSRRQLFPAMSRLEGGPGFVERLNSEFAGTGLEKPLKDVLGICGLVYEFGYALPVGTAANASGVPASELLDAITTGDLGDWVDLGRQGLQMRHRQVARLLVESVLSDLDKYRLSLQLAKSLSPLISRSAIFVRSLPYRIVRNILDAGVVSRRTGDRAVEWYAELEELYSWNARYWEQRSLTHLARGDYAAALSFAEQAVDRHRDPFTQTTLAKVMLTQLRAATAAGHELDVNRYQEAIGLLVNARDAVRRDEVPYEVFFMQVLGLAADLGARGELPRDVLRDIEEWVTAAERTELMEYPEYARLVRRARRMFEGLATPPSPA